MSVVRVTLRSVFIAAVWGLVVGINVAWPTERASAAEYGFGRVDITPTEPFRLSGYGNRTEPFESIGTPLWCRAMVIRQSDGLAALVSVDTIGLPGTLTDRIAERLRDRFQIERDRFVLAATHSHTAPHIAGGLTNIFAEPLTAQEAARADAYAESLVDKVVEAVAKGVNDLAPGEMYFSEGKVGFARHRRVVQEGAWTGFGENPDGPVDHSLPLLVITDGGPEGKLRGMVFNYACHCTTFGPGYNKVNGDWAGYAAADLEERHPEAVALCTIGCGADANPQRDNDPEQALELSRSQGRMIALEVERLLKQEGTPISGALQSAYGFAGLPSDRPSIAELKQRLEGGRIQDRRHAEEMLAIHARMGRLPETYPAPVQTWRFGEELSMVFLGGEVVSEYALRLKEELKAPHQWITAYANDVFGYVASERMRAEGGYEVDGSMIYYSLPGRWSTGTEDVLIRRVHELMKTTGTARPLDPEQALSSIQVPDGFVVDLVTCEPLISDPVNIAVDAAGRLWVVEMGDYPRGAGDSGQPGGRIKILTDEDGDGRYDSATVFLEDLPYPTGVFPWRNGAFVSAAPDIVFVADTDGDGVADQRETWFTGFDLANPQHRVNGFRYGLDGWIHVAVGDGSSEVECVKAGAVVNVSGRDMRFHPETGELEPISGRSQYGRCRDEFGNWFGNDNSRPLYHFAIEDRYLRRNPYVASPDARVHLLDPPTAPPIFPISRTLDRFNDVWAADRFTSACSPQIFLDDFLGADIQGDAFICEPVHNLVHRTQVIPEGVTFRGTREPTEQNSEFYASTDPWSRPVNTITAPDGTLWVVDMYRQVIEHPQWIPEAWQARLDLYAGSDRGRIYRVRREDESPRPIPNLTNLSDLERVDRLASPNGWERDTAQRMLCEAVELPAPVIERLRSLAVNSSFAPARLHAAGVLSYHNELDASVLTALLSARDARLVRRSVVFAEPHLDDHQTVFDAVVALTAHDDIALRYQAALSLGESARPQVAAALATLARRDPGNPWIKAAVLSSSRSHADRLLGELVAAEQPAEGLVAWIPELAATALGDDPLGSAPAVLDPITRTQPGGVQPWQLSTMSSVVDALNRRKVDWPAIVKAYDREPWWPAVTRLVTEAGDMAGQSAAPLETRLAATTLLGRIISGEGDLDALGDLLEPHVPLTIQQAAVQALAASRHAAVPKTLLTAWGRMSPSLRSQTVQVLLSRNSWTAALLTAAENGTVEVVAFSPAARQNLLALPDENVRTRAAALFEVANSPERVTVLEDYAVAAKLTGDPATGREVFAKNCAACHRHHDVGQEVGPKLSALQDKSFDALLTAILDPNRAVEDKYQGYAVALQDGRVLTGLVLSETATSLSLAQADGKVETILRVDIEELRSTGRSAMPEGLEKTLSVKDLADVVSFVQSGK